MNLTGVWWLRLPYPGWGDLWCSMPGCDGGASVWMCYPPDAAQAAAALCPAHSKRLMDIQANGEGCRKR